MNDPLVLLLSLLSGLLLGIIFFGGLWWTVRRGLSSNEPAAWFFISLILRTAITVFGFYVVMHGDWKCLAACLSGFVIARVAILRLTRYRLGDNRQAAHGRVD